MQPELECDLVMKGGVTSGVVYPPAILKLAEKFRFRNIGGASVGAIAAAMAACAEYARASGIQRPGAGFAGLAAVEAELTKEGFIRGRFQPQQSLAPLYDALWSWLDLSRAEPARSPPPTARRWLVLLHRAWTVGRRCFEERHTQGVVLGVFAGLLLSAGFLSWAFVLLQHGGMGPTLGAAGLLLLSGALGFVGGVLGGFTGAALEAWRLVWKLAGEESIGFGLCPGSRERRAGGRGGMEDPEPPLTDWLHRTLNALAGRGPDEPSVTFAELSARGVTLRLMATNVSLSQLWTLPLRRGRHSFYFRKDELSRLFPPPVMRQLVAWAEAHSPSKLKFRPGEEGRYLRLPLGEEMPVLVATRLSLSFPVLLSAVPLYAFRSEAYARSGRGGFVDLETDVERHWVSDGGIASNFPIHLFDAWVPTRPTFGITLYDSPVRRVLSQLEDALPLAVLLPRPKDFDLARPHRVSVRGLRDFLAAVLNTTLSFREIAQSSLPSYRERIVQVLVEPHEGGLNLDMSPEVVRALAEKGRRAGELLLARYYAETPQGPRLSEGFLEHQWVRSLVLFGQLELELSKLRALGGMGADWREQLRARFEALFTAQLASEEGWYRPKDEAWSREALRRIDALLALVEQWTSRVSLRSPVDAHFSLEPPRPEAMLRITPDI